MNRICTKCGTEMVSQKVVDPETGEKKIEDQCFHCGFTDSANPADIEE